MRRRWWPHPAALSGQEGWLASRWLAVAPIAYVIVLTVIEVVTQAHRHLLSFYAPAVIFAGIVCTVWFTLLILVLAMGAVVGIVLGYGVAGADKWTVSGALILTSVIAVGASGLRTRSEVRFARISAVAEKVQSIIMQPPPRSIGQVEVAAIYLPAEREAKVGGDLYTGLRTPHAARFVIGDVRGKGLDALRVAAGTIAGFKAMAPYADDLAELADRLDHHVRQDEGIPAPDNLESQFVTALLVEIPDEEPIVRFISCGHPPPLLVPAAGAPRFVEFDEPTLPLNLWHSVESRDRSDIVAMSFAAGDRLLLYTDGVTEARDVTGRFYPLDTRFPTDTVDGESVLSLLRADLAAFSEQLEDDAAMLLLTRRPADG